MRHLYLAGCVGLFLSGYIAAAASSPVVPVKDVRLAEWSFAQGHISGGYWALAKVVECISKDSPGGEVGKDVIVGCVQKVETWLDQAREAIGGFRQ
jgi:hypothetical protein